jgi:uncharacterized protein (DUF488 family)
VNSLEVDMAEEQRGPTILTIGHSTRAIEELAAMLRGHEVKLLADVRRFPASRRHPQFNRETLATALEREGFAYRWFEALGGRRPPLPVEQSPNAGWKNDAFRGYADYMQTPEFETALEELEAIARRLPAAIMCAEALEWQCHRRLIADALFVRGWTIRHIHSADAAQTTEHTLPAFARAEGTRITYPPGDAGLFE